MSRKKSKSGKPWSKTVGANPELTAFERGDRGGDIWTRRWNAERKKYDNKQYLCATIRVNGKIDHELENAAIAQTIERQKAMAAHGVPEVGDAPLTLLRASQRMLHPIEGKFATETEWKTEVKRHLDIIVDMLGKTTVAANIKHADYRRLWRALATANRDNGSYGFRSAEMIVGTLRSMMIWLQGEGLVELGSGTPAPGWKQAMRSEWTDITDKAVAEPKRPRYTPEESAKLWRALPKADPRLQMLLVEGAELRLGQVRRGLRSNIFAHKHHEIGGVVIVGRGKKRGETVLFTDRQRAFVIAEMSHGFLSELERAYQAKQIEDYRLVPGGFLARGKAQVKNAMEIPSDRAMRKWWRRLEQLAGVPYVRGRGWYGERRQRIQKGEKDTQASATAKNRLSGHTKTQTREIYVGVMDDTFVEEARDLRERTRPTFGGDNA